LPDRFDGHRIYLDTSWLPQIQSYMLKQWAIRSHWYVLRTPPSGPEYFIGLTFLYMPTSFSTFRTGGALDTLQFSNGIVKVGILSNQNSHFHFGFGQFETQIRKEVFEFCVANILADFL